MSVARLLRELFPLRVAEFVRLQLSVAVSVSVRNTDTDPKCYGSNFTIEYWIISNNFLGRVPGYLMP